MKKILLIILIFAGSVNLNAQNSEAHRKKIKALKTAYITQELNMSPEVSQKFWPIYNAYEIRKKKLHNREHREIINLSCLNESSANEMLHEYLEIEKEEYRNKKQLFANLKDIMSAREIIQLHKLEEDFNKKLIREYRERKAQKRKEQQEEE